MYRYYGRIVLLRSNCNEESHLDNIKNTVIDEKTFLKRVSASEDHAERHAPYLKAMTCYPGLPTHMPLRGSFLFSDPGVE